MLAIVTVRLLQDCLKLLDLPLQDLSLRLGSLSKLGQNVSSDLNLLWANTELGLGQLLRIIELDLLVSNHDALAEGLRRLVAP